MNTNLFKERTNVYGKILEIEKIIETLPTDTRVTALEEAVSGLKTEISDLIDLIATKQTEIEQEEITVEADQWDAETLQASISTSALITSKTIVAPKGNATDIGVWKDSEVIALDITEDGTLTLQCGTVPTSELNIVITYCN